MTEVREQQDLELMKNIRVVVGVAVVLSAGAVAIWMWPTSQMGLCHVHHDKGIYGKDEAVKQILNRVLPARPSLPSYYPTEAESNELVRVFVEITDAYTNAPLSVLIEKFAMIPDFITNVAESVCIDVQRSLYVPFERFLIGSVSDGIVRSSKCDVLVVRNQE